MTEEELPRFLAAAEEEGQPFTDLFKLLLFTGARVTNVRSMKWANLNFKTSTWMIPADESKNKSDMAIPLVGPALGILKRRLAKAEQTAAETQEERSPYVFPVMRNKGERGYIGSPWRPFRRVCKRAEIEGLRIHDLRRSLGAWQAMQGASLPIIGKALGHKDHRATQIYARLSDNPVRRSMEKATEAMMKPNSKEDKPDKQTDSNA